MAAESRYGSAVADLVLKEEEVDSWQSELNGLQFDVVFDATPKRHINLAEGTESRKRYVCRALLKEEGKFLDQEDVLLLPVDLDLLESYATRVANNEIPHPVGLADESVCHVLRQGRQVIEDPRADVHFSRLIRVDPCAAFLLIGVDTFKSNTLMIQELCKSLQSLARKNSSCKTACTVIERSDKSISRNVLLVQLWVSRQELQKFQLTEPYLAAMQRLKQYQCLNSVFIATDNCDVLKKAKGLSFEKEDVKLDVHVAFLKVLPGKDLEFFKLSRSTLLSCHANVNCQLFSIGNLLEQSGCEKERGNYLLVHVEKSKISYTQLGADDVVDAFKGCCQHIYAEYTSIHRFSFRGIRCSSGRHENINFFMMSITLPTYHIKGCALVKIFSVAFNPEDLQHIRATLKTCKDLTWTPGLEFSGLIVGLSPEEKGDKNSRFFVGDEVFGVNFGDAHPSGLVGGALAEYCMVPFDRICHKPESISFETAAAITTSGCLAYRCFANLLTANANGETVSDLMNQSSVAVFGAETPIGVLAISFAKAANMRYDMNKMFFLLIFIRHSRHVNGKGGGGVCLCGTCQVRLRLQR